MKTFYEDTTTIFFHEIQTKYSWQFLCYDDKYAIYLETKETLLRDKVVQMEHSQEVLCEDIS